MKILFVHDHIFKRQGASFYSAGGLPARVWQRYLDVFDSLQVVGRDGGVVLEGGNDYTLSSCDNVCFNLMPSISNIKSLLFGNRFVLEECKRLVAESDGVIARLPSRLGVLFVEESIRQGKPYAVEVVGCAWDSLWNYGDLRGKVMAPLEFYSVKKAVMSAKFALYVTRFFLQGRYPSQGETVFCSDVVIPDIQNDIFLRSARVVNALPKKLIFGLIGNFTSKYKGIDIAIRALSSADLGGVEWEFQILGSGDCSRYLRLAESLGIGDKVKFIGSLSSGAAVFDWLDTVTIYLQPSLTEGMPRALVEAMSRGCPALASKVGGISELLNPEQMVNPGDHTALANKIVKLVEDPSLMEKLSFENLDKSREYYKSVLEARRLSFLISFKRYIDSKNN